MKTIVIDPVTRIEGHSKITLHLNDDGEVENAYFHVTQFRGFEKLSEGRPFYEMPSLMARICGICPVSHLIASAKACDALLAVQIPHAGSKLRRIMNLAQVIQSHALSFFYLSSPDLLLGMDADPSQRNIYGVAKARPDLARGGIRLRQFGQQVIELLGGKRIHPGWIVPGGVSEPLTAEKRDEILKGLPEAMDIAQRTLAWFKFILPRYQEEIRAFANFPTLFMGTVNEEGAMKLYDGKLRVVDANRQIVHPGFEASQYADYIGEAVEDFTYLKSPYYKPAGYPDGIYRVGPLARMMVSDRISTHHAQAEFEEFHKMDAWQLQSSFHMHYARLIEIMYCIERIEESLRDPDILNPRVRAYAEPNSLEGVGMSEAPRGTLIHHYKIDENGLITWANLIIATGHNNLAMNRGVLQVAQHFVKGNALQEGMLNRVEAVIRAYDPCLSCSTHAVGQMPLKIELHSPDGQILDTVAR